MSRNGLTSMVEIKLYDTYNFQTDWIIQMENAEIQIKAIKGKENGNLMVVSLKDSGQLKPTICIAWSLNNSLHDTAL